MTTLLESHYFPCLTYLSEMKRCTEVWIETKEHFVKQAYRNRCYILSANGVLPLTVPVKGASKKIPMDEIEIDYEQKWMNNHWRSIQSAYNSSPFFLYYAPHIHDILFSKHKTLFRLNQALLLFALKAFHIETVLHDTSTYQAIYPGEMNDLRSLIHPKRKSPKQRHFVDKPYKQLFTDKFVSNLSMLDLLSCAGPNSGTFL